MDNSGTPKAAAATLPTYYVNVNIKEILKQLSFLFINVCGMANGYKKI
jgi:hypothetical protein